MATNLLPLAMSNLALHVAPQHPLLTTTVAEQACRYLLHPLLQQTTAAAPFVANLATMNSNHHTAAIPPQGQTHPATTGDQHAAGAGSRSLHPSSHTHLVPAAHLTAPGGTVVTLEAAAKLFLGCLESLRRLHISALLSRSSSGSSSKQQRGGLDPSHPSNWRPAYCLPLDLLLVARAAVR